MKGARGALFPLLRAPVLRHPAVRLAAAINDQNKVSSFSLGNKIAVLKLHEARRPKNTFSITRRAVRRP